MTTGRRAVAGTHMRSRGSPAMIASLGRRLSMYVVAGRSGHALPSGSRSGSTSTTPTSSTPVTAAPAAADRSASGTAAAASASADRADQRHRRERPAASTGASGNT